jgi:hypothetical protein
MSDKEITLVLLDDEWHRGRPVESRIATIPPLGLSALETLQEIRVCLRAATPTVELISLLRKRQELPNGAVAFEPIPAAEFDELPPGCVEIDGLLHRKRTRRLVDFQVMTADEHVERSKPFARKCQTIVDHPD